MGFLIFVSSSYLVYGFLCMDFGLQVKVEVQILLGDVQEYGLYKFVIVFKQIIVD